MNTANRDLRQPRWLIVLLVGAQLLLPAMGLGLRWAGIRDTSPMSWHMFSTTQR